MLLLCNLKHSMYEGGDDVNSIESDGWDAENNAGSVTMR